MIRDDGTVETDPIDSLPTVWRPLGMLTGVLLLVPALFLAWAGLEVPLIYGRSTGLARLLLSMASVWAAFLCVFTSWRLLTNRGRADGGLVSPLFLRGAALLFAAIPILALATGSWRSAGEHPVFVAIRLVVYVGAAITLFRLAGWRETRMTRLPESADSRNGKASDSSSDIK